MEIKEEIFRNNENAFEAIPNSPLNVNKLIKPARSDAALFLKQSTPIRPTNQSFDNKLARSQQNKKSGEHFDPPQSTKPIVNQWAQNDTSEYTVLHPLLLLIQPPATT